VQELCVVSFAVSSYSRVSEPLGGVAWLFTLLCGHHRTTAVVVSFITLHRWIILCRCVIVDGLPRLGIVCFAVGCTEAGVIPGTEWHCCQCL